MIFTKLIETANKNLDKKALNAYTYKSLFDKVENSNYVSVSESYDERVIIDILVAAKENKPIAILPKFKRDTVNIPENLPRGFGIMLFSSGTTGPRKPIWLHEGMILANAKSAIVSQGIDPADKILTVSSLNHTGGLNVQTIPGLLMGSEITYKQFNAFSFFKDIEGHTITHLVPVMIDALMNVKNQSLPSSVRLVVAGSDCVSKAQAEFWQSKNVNFMINYGLTEAGPVICNHIFKPDESLDIFDQGVPLGDTFWTDYAVKDGELALKGNAVNKPDWLFTGDCVSKYNEWLIYLGRKSAGCQIVSKQY